MMFLLLSVKKSQATEAVLLDRNLSSLLLAGCKKDCTICCKKDCTVLVYNIFDTIIQQDTGDGNGHKNSYIHTADPVMEDP